MRLTKNGTKRAMRDFFFPDRYDDGALDFILFAVLRMTSALGDKNKALTHQDFDDMPRRI